MSSGPPSAASPSSIISQQNDATKTAYGNAANASNTTSPFSSNTFAVDPSTGRITQNQSYSPQEQALFNMFTGAGGIQPTALGGAGTALSQYLQSTGGKATPNLIQGSNSLTNGMMNNYLASMQPGVQQSKSNMESDLANKGLFESTQTNTGNTPGGGQNAADRAHQNWAQGVTAAQAGALAQFEPQAFNMEQTAAFDDPFKAFTSLSQLGAPIGLTPPSGPNVPVNPANASEANKVGFDQKSKSFGSGVNGVIGLMNGLFGGGTGGSGGAGGGLLASLFGGAGDVGLGSWGATVLPAMMI